MLNYFTALDYRTVEDNCSTILRGRNSRLLSPFPYPFLCFRGSLTTLGDDTDPGTLVAANGAVIEFGKDIIGHGTIDTPNDSLRPLIVNGSVLGNSGAEPIILEGYVKGVGDFANIVINGTLSPGFSPTVARYTGDIIFGTSATLELEVGGYLPGSEHDQLIFENGSVTFDGSLEIVLLGGFTPQLRDTFDLFDFDAVAGEFANFELPSLEDGLAFDTSSLMTTGELRVVPEPAATALVLCGLTWMLLAVVPRMILSRAGDQGSSGRMLL